MRKLTIFAIVTSWIGCAVFLTTLYRVPFTNTEIATQLKSSVVMVLDMESNMGGTGFHVRTLDQGFTGIITNAHVCKNEPIKLVFDHSIIPVAYKVVKKDPVVDLCYLVSTEDSYDFTRWYNALELADSTQPLDTVSTGGFPFLEMFIPQHDGYILKEYNEIVGQLPEANGQCVDGRSPRSVNIYTGQKSAVKTCHYQRTVYWISLYSVPGMSGSPVVDSWGHVVGVMSEMHTQLGIGGIVRLEDVHKFVNGLGIR